MIKNLKEKERIYSYWNHNYSGEPICDIINTHLSNLEKFNFCEVGCELGGLSDLVVQEFKNSNVYAVDIKNYNPSVFNNLAKTDRFKFILGSSLECYKEFEDEFFDMIYIDTDPHKYQFLKQEILYWTPKVKKGGIVAFHDYDHPYHPEVKICIDEYCEKNQIKLNITAYHNVFFIKT